MRSARQSKHGPIPEARQHPVSDDPTNDSDASGYGSPKVIGPRPQLQLPAILKSRWHHQVPHVEYCVGGMFDGPGMEGLWRTSMRTNSSREPSVGNLLVVPS